MADLDRELLDGIVRDAWEEWKKLDADSTSSRYDALDAAITMSVAAYLDATRSSTLSPQDSDE